MIKEKTVTIFICNICGHEWQSEKYNRNDPPVFCAKCKNAAWNRNKK